MFYAPLPPSPPTGLRWNPSLRRLRVKRVSAAFAGMAAAVSLIASIADLPVLSTEAGYAMIITAAGFYLGVVLSDTIRARVATMLVAATIAGGVSQLDVLRHDGKPETEGRTAGGDGPDQPKPEPAPLRAEVGRRPLASVRAFRRHWVLHRNGEVMGLDGDGVERAHFEVKGPGEDIVACAGGLLIAHGNGLLSRFTRRGRHQRTYPYGKDDGQLACGGGSAWVSRPNEGSVVQLHPRKLAFQNEFPRLTDDATSITFGLRALWMVDAERSEVVGVDPISEQKLGPYPVLEDPQQIAVLAGSLWIMHREIACLMRFDVDRRQEVGPGVPLGRDAQRMAAHGDTISIVDYADGTMRQVDVHDRPLEAKTLQIPNVDRLADVDGGRRRLSVVDKTGGAVLMFDRAARRALQPAPAAPRSSGCPARAA